MKNMTKLRKLFIFGFILLFFHTAISGVRAGSSDKVSGSLDEKWNADNQALVALIKDKKVAEALKKGEAMLAYLEKKNLMEGPEAGTTYNNLGTIYMYTGAFGKSQAHLLKALQLRAKLFGENSLEVAAVWINLSQLYKLQAQRIIKSHQKDGGKGKTEKKE